MMRKVKLYNKLFKKFKKSLNHAVFSLSVAVVIEWLMEDIVERLILYLPHKIMQKYRLHADRKR